MEPKTNMTSSSSEATSQKSGRILIVDDHPYNVEILEELFGIEHHLAIAVSGEEALTLTPEFCPDLILLDIMMPGIGGFETCRQIRANPDLSHIKIIMVSAKARESDIELGFQAGADDYVTKPFIFDEIRAKVRYYLSISKNTKVG